MEPLPPPSQHPVVHIGALELRFLADETTGSGDLVMFEFTVPPGARVPAPHFHERVDEAVYGLSGCLASRRGEERFAIRPGDSLLIPRGVVHHHENLLPEPAKVLVVLTPGSIGRRYFEETAALLARPGPPDPAAMQALMRRHGLVPA
ncbi:cupin domain-containing protein [Rhodovarius crocodyli]|uniref:Cupin domain-containing protein n=1 Tax=Rhodovarius crocodyli TaxID=1979269 RepID=A0A437LXC4_9PROT|nr:cupin domain-containing protein [Rhodovarius crocodyli]RVT90036.1 cupin domain-containing protein [Rhodovarius crocodyli]